MKKVRERKINTKTKGKQIIDTENRQMLSERRRIEGWTKQIKGLKGRNLHL